VLCIYTRHVGEARNIEMLEVKIQVVTQCRNPIASHVVVDDPFLGVYLWMHFLFLSSIGAWIIYSVIYGKIVVLFWGIFGP
jgi:hypothetical protein